jgi:two-component sensor histidine kinase
MNRFLYRVLITLLIVHTCHNTVNASIRPIADSLSNAFKLSDDDISRAGILIELSELWLDSSVFQSLTYAEDALAMSKRSGWIKGQINSVLAIGRCYTAIREWDEALRYYSWGLKLAENSRRDPDILEALTKVSETYDAAGLDSVSLPYKLRALGLAHKLNDTFLEAQMLTYLGGYYLDNGLFKQSVKYYRSAHALLNSTANRRAVSMTMNNLAVVYLALGKEDSSYILLRDALEIAREWKDVTTEVIVLTSLSDYYKALRRGNCDSAIKYARDAVHMALSSKVSKDLQEKVLWLLYTLYDRDKDSKDKLAVFEEYIKVRDEVRNETRFSEDAKAMMRYEFDLRTATTTAEKNALQGRYDLQKKILRWAGAGIIFLGLLAAIYYYSLLQNRRKARTIRLQADELIDQKRTIQQTLEDKKVLLKEIHHRVKNNLQVISALLQLQGKRTEDPHVKEALVESQNRVMSMAFIHYNLYQHDDINGVEMKSFLAELVGHLRSIYTNSAMSVSIDQEVGVDILDLETAIPLALIINELLTNSYKYAFTGRENGEITLMIRQHDEMDSYYFEYRDSGIGLNFDANKEKGKTLGLTLIHDLCRQLGTRPNFIMGAGFRLSFVFKPVNREDQP